MLDWVRKEDVFYFSISSQRHRWLIWSPGKWCYYAFYFKWCYRVVIFLSNPGFRDSSFYTRKKSLSTVIERARVSKQTTGLLSFEGPPLKEGKAFLASSFVNLLLLSTCRHSHLRKFNVDGSRYPASLDHLLKVETKRFYDRSLDRCNPEVI